MFEYRAPCGFTYGPEHNRLKQCIGDVCSGSPTTTLLYLNDPITGSGSEKSTSGTTVIWYDYIVADGGIVAEHVSNMGVESMQYFVLDHLGSTVALTDNSGNTLEQDAYDPYGKRRNVNGSTDANCTLTSATTRGFSGHEMIDSMCLTDMNARMYDQTMGRFLSADNVDFDPGNGQDLNPYAYVDGQPTVFTDLTGNIEQVVVDHPLLPQDKVNGVPMPAGTADAVESVIGGTGAPGTGENVVVTGHRRHQEPLGGFAINPSPFGFLIDVSVFGGSGGTKQDMLCNNANAVSFVKHHEADAAAVAQQLQVPTSFVLGLSAAESQYGTNRFSRLGNNFFSLQGNASSPFANGSMQAQNSSAQLSTFPSYAASAQSFAAQYGAGVRGADTPEQFAQDLVDEVFNTANAETGGDPHFVSKTASVINSVARRMKC